MAGRQLEEMRAQQHQQHQQQQAEDTLSAALEFDDDDMEVRELTKDNLNDMIECVCCGQGGVQMRVSSCMVCVIDGVFFFLDNFVRLIGPVFVSLVWVLILGIVLAWYLVLAPYMLELHGWLHLIPHAVLAHWLLLNVMFHYYMGSMTNGGVPPSEAPRWYPVRAQRKTCPKCRKFKPPRSHHCSVCRSCVLNMDHHCPWFGRCIGHYNHRYFFLFMVYIWSGCLYIALVTWTPFSMRARLMSPLAEQHALEDTMVVSEHLPTQKATLAFCFILTTAVLIALGLLISWHVFLISTGQTTIEFYSNINKRSDAKRYGEVWRNPYNFGIRKNWSKFLGLNNKRGLLSVLLPSRHRPSEDGVTWETIYSKPQAVV